MSPNSYLPCGLLWLALSSLSLASPATSPPAPSATTATTCTVTAYSAVASATASCTNIVLKDITVPGNSTLNLSKLKQGTTVTFEGTTFFEFGNSNYNMITAGGTDITILGAPGHVINGNGQAWWDGQGSNGGQPKPDHFFVAENFAGTANVIRDLNIENYPTHCFEVTNAKNLEMKNIYLNNLAGNAPNAKSSGLPAAHNTDGFDVSGSTNVTIHDNTVLNQDDCVAITSGDSIEVYNMFCDGSHGLSIGSVGGKSNNNVTNIYFHDSILNNVQNGCRIKTNAGTTGFISGVTYENIAVNNASIYGIDIQQDYLNGGPTGIPTNGVIIQDILIKNILGDVCCGAKDVYVLCGAGSCSNITLDDILIVGGSSECDVKTEGNYRCPLVPVPTNSTA